MLERRRAPRRSDGARPGAAATSTRHGDAL